MQANPQSVSSLVNNTLWDHILSHTVPTLEEIDKIEKDIRHQDEPFRSYLTALLMASQNDFDKAVTYFLTALKTENEFIASNYLAYLGFSAHNLFHREELFRLEERYCTSEHRRVARNIAYSLGNTKLIRKYNLKLLALYDGEQRQRYKDEGDHMISLVENFKTASTLTTNEIEILCDEVEGIANRHGVNCVGVSYFVSSEADNAYIVRAETEDPYMLAELNIELSDLLSDEKYCSKPFTSWFKSDSSRKEKSQ
ncbi:hypothetical protein [Erwinia sp. QL-Z3]|uniref:hypothetical protein n=1 Tax=Erwinia sp. QL-Z3 TaxID=2547962 RepID=UPI0010714048|nr:hypothetical protein [Erwinia sp. QL-Z3]QBR52645.1 hypothetical protein E2F51_22925 [Erwinia sp. QL-Z3]